MKTIKEVEKERDEILAKALKLAELFKETRDLDEEDLDAIAAIEALQPKLEPLDGWMNRYPDGTFGQELYPSREKALLLGSAAIPVHIREITPSAVEVPQWEEWVCSGPFQRMIRCDGSAIGSALDDDEAGDLIEAHNAEMRRLQETIDALLAERGIDE